MDPGDYEYAKIALDVQVQDGALRLKRSSYEGRQATSWLEELRASSLQQCRERDQERLERTTEIHAEVARSVRQPDSSHTLHRAFNAFSESIRQT